MIIINLPLLNPPPPEEGEEMNFLLDLLLWRGRIKEGNPL
jgi:hypothetical protein